MKKNKTIEVTEVRLPSGRIVRVPFPDTNEFTKKKLFPPGARFAYMDKNNVLHKYVYVHIVSDRPRDTSKTRRIE